MADERIPLLVETGLTEPQARVYAALADLGRGTAREAGEHAGVPRTRVYPALHALQDMGLVQPEGDAFVPIPLDAYLEGRAAAALKRHADLIARRDALARAYAPGAPATGPGAIRLVRGRTRPAEVLTAALREARDRVEAALCAPTLATLLGPGRAGDALRDAVERAPHVRVVLHATSADVARLEDVPPGLLVRMRIAPRAWWHLDRVVVDRRQLFLRFGAAGASHDMGLVTGHPGLVADAAAAVEQVWEEGRATYAVLAEARRRVPRSPPGRRRGGARPAPGRGGGGE